MKVYILWWKYYDGSGMEVVRAYADGARATADQFLLQEEAAGKLWSVTELEVQP